MNINYKLGAILLLLLSVLCGYGQPNMRINTLTIVNGFTNSGLARLEDSTVIDADADVTGTLTAQGALTVLNTTTLHGLLKIPPRTNANAWVVSVITNTFQRNITATNGTVTFTGAATDGAIVYYELVNTSVTNFDITIPSSVPLQTTGNGAITSATCVSNSVTVFRWERVSGAWHVAIYGPDQYVLNFGPNAAAGHLFGIHSLTGGPGGSMIATNLAAAAGGGSGTNANSMTITNFSRWLPQTNFFSGTTNVFIDISTAGYLIRVTATNNFGIHFTNIVAADSDGKEFRIEIKQDATGNRIGAMAGRSNWRFGTDITGLTYSTNAAYIDQIKVVVRNTNAFVVGFLRGYQD